MGRPSLRRAFLASLLFLVAALAGCASDPPAPEGEEVDDPDATAPTAPAAGGAPTPPLSDDPREAAAERVSRELERLGEEPGRFLMVVETVDATRPGERATDTLYVDSANGTSFYRLFTERAASAGEDALVAQVGTTFLTGQANASLLAVRDEAAAPFRTPANLSELALSGKLPGPLFGNYYVVPTMTLMRAGHMPTYAAREVEDVTVDGRAATRASFGAEGRTGSVFVLDKETGRILSANLTQSTGGPATKFANVTFRYGAEAAHPWTDALARAATMAVLDKPAFKAVQVEPRATTNHTWTVEPSPSNATVALSEAELRVYPRGGAARNAPLATLPLEQGSAAGSVAELSFEDADGDGRVSEGDLVTVRVTRPRDDLSDYFVALADETTTFLVALH